MLNANNPTVSVKYPASINGVKSRPSNLPAGTYFTAALVSGVAAPRRLFFRAIDSIHALEDDTGDGWNVARGGGPDMYDVTPVKVAITVSPL